MLEKVVAGSSKAEAPRGLVLSFRDRPNRMTADTVFWSVAMEQGEQWVEMNLVAVPEQPEPSNNLGEYDVVEVDASNEGAARELEASVTGLAPLSAGGMRSLRQNSRRCASRATGPPVSSSLCCRCAPSPEACGIDLMLVKHGANAVRRPLLGWAIAWLRNNRGRRTRTRVNVDDTAQLTALKDAGFTPGEIGLLFTRTVDKAEIDARMEERKAHGTIIKFGDWR